MTVHRKAVLVAAAFAATACAGDAGEGDTTTDAGSVSAGNAAAGADAVDPMMVMNFLRTVDAHEIQAGKVAQDKATSTQVRDYARMMVTDHCRSLTTAATMIAVVQAMALAAPRLAATSAIKRDVLTTTTPNTPSARAAGRTQTTRTTP